MVLINTFTMFCTPGRVVLSNAFFRIRRGMYCREFVKFCPRPASGSRPGSRPGIVRQEPGKVRLGFIPDEWYMAFYKKTGASGAGTFFGTIMITLMSKEIYVLEHEYYGGLSFGLLCVLATKYVGPIIAQYIDSEIDEYENSWQETRNHSKAEVENSIANEVKLQESSEAQLVVIAAKRENVLLQLEAVYRERLMHAYNETKKRLEFCMAREAIETAVAKRCMTDWVIKEVQEAVTKEIKEKAMAKCLEDLKDLAKLYEQLGGEYEPPDSPADPPDMKPK